MFEGHDTLSLCLRRYFSVRERSMSSVNRWQPGDSYSTLLSLLIKWPSIALIRNPTLTIRRDGMCWHMNIHTLPYLLGTLHFSNTLSTFTTPDLNLSLFLSLSLISRPSFTCLYHGGRVSCQLQLREVSYAVRPGLKLQRHRHPDHPCTIISTQLNSTEGLRHVI